MINTMKKLEEQRVLLILTIVFFHAYIFTKKMTQLDDDIYIFCKIIIANVPILTKDSTGVCRSPVVGGGPCLKYGLQLISHTFHPTGGGHCL